MQRHAEANAQLKEYLLEDTDQFRLAKAFLSQLHKPDAQQLRTVVTDDVLWTFPGKASISGEAVGVEGVMTRARVIAAHQVEVEIVRVVYGFSGLAVLLHNTGSRNGRILDEYLAAVFQYRGDRVSRLDSYLSDVPIMEKFFT